VETKLKQPANPVFIDAYAKGALSRAEHFNTVIARTEISDDFEGDLANWVNVQGRLSTIGGNATAYDFFGYAAAYHQTQLLSDNCRAKIVVQGGFITAGKSAIVICADKKFTLYYGLVIETGIINNKFHIVRGTGPKTREILDSLTVEIDPADTAEIWFDSINSVLRAYYNGSEVLAVEVERNNIPHGPGRRYTGVVMGVDWFLAPGVLFDDFDAWDVALPGPFLRDGFDSVTVSADWTEIDDGVAIHRHLLVPNTLGPDHAFWTDAAILHATQGSTDSVKIVLRVMRFGEGTYTVALCSNPGMTNWAGIQFEAAGLINRVHVVTGTGPTTYAYVGEYDWELTTSGTVFVITYDAVDNFYRLYRNTSTVPLLEWEDEANVVTHGAGQRYVGMVWETSVLSSGVEPSMFEAYNVTADTPLPIPPVEEGS